MRFTSRIVIASDQVATAINSVRPRRSGSGVIDTGEAARAQQKSVLLACAVSVEANYRAIVANALAGCQGGSRKVE